VSEEMPRVYTREKFEGVGVEATDEEVAALNRCLHEMVRAFREGEPHAHILDDLVENHDRGRMAMLAGVARSFLREGD
jgi:hypothetical protein